MGDGRGWTPIAHPPHHPSIPITHHPPSTTHPSPSSTPVAHPSQSSNPGIYPSIPSTIHPCHPFISITHPPISIIRLSPSFSRPRHSRHSSIHPHHPLLTVIHPHHPSHASIPAIHMCHHPSCPILASPSSMLPHHLDARPVWMGDGYGQWVDDRDGGLTKSDW